MQGTGGSSRRHQDLQRWPWINLDKVSDDSSAETNPSGKRCSRLVIGKGRSHPEEAHTMLQMRRAGTRESDLWLDSKPEASMLQVRRHRLLG